MKRAVLFLNLGGPEKLADVKLFLYRLFEDPEIIRIKFSPLRKMIARSISTFREKTSQAMYAKIGGGSPIRRLSDLQSEDVEARFRRQGADISVRTAFSCSNPLVEDVVQNLYQSGVRRFLGFPLYPQYSLTTTKGALDRTKAAVKKFAPEATLSVLGSFPTHPMFIEAHAQLIQEALLKFSNPDPRQVHLLFSAHSIPKKLVTKDGDPYEKEMMETVKHILARLNWRGPWTLAWQSKLGPMEWLSPSTTEVVEQLGKDGKKQVLVVPVSFVTDHVETIYEIDQLIAETAKTAGISEFRRTPGLNNNSTFMECLVSLINSQKEFWKD